MFIEIMAAKNLLYQLWRIIVKLTQKQKNELLNAYFKAKDANTLLEIDMKTVRERSNARRATYLQMKKSHKIQLTFTKKEQET